MTSPAISILMPSYNHAQFIEAAIRSVLAQTRADFELIVVDDGSSDASPRIIAEQRDPRVRFHLLEQNQGACHAMNVALQMSRGELLAVCNSDDLWHPEKLSRQIGLLETLPNAGAVFCDVSWIGDDGLELSKLPPFARVFQQQNRSRWSWVRRFLESGNCLCHPSILAKREAYDVAGLYDNRLRQLPDMDMWIRVLEHFDIFVMPEKLVSFRMHAHNTSMPSPEASRRDLNEHRLILRKTFERMSGDYFIKALGSKCVEIDDDLDLQIEQAFYLLSHHGIYTDIFQELGLDILFDVCKDAAGLTRLSNKFGFEVADFHRAMGMHARGNSEQLSLPLHESRKLLRDRSYLIQNDGQGESIHSSTGEVYHVKQDQTQGSMEEIKIRAETIQILGWAVDPAQLQPAKTILLFLGNQFLGYGGCGEIRPDIMRRFAAPSALYAGFHFEFQQNGSVDKMERPRLFILSKDDQATELPCGLVPITINYTKMLSSAQPFDLILGGDWSVRESWGVWSEGTRGSVIFDASSLPENYTIAIEANVFPPGPVPMQQIQVFDGDRNLLATISNEQPIRNVVVSMKQSRSQRGPFRSLNFEIGNPTSPHDLGISEDIRKIGIGLISLTFQARSSPVS